MAHVIVIGSGAVGLCTAWHLLRDGADVTVVSTLEPSHEIGWGSVAWSNASSKVRLGYPDHYVALNQHGMTAGRALAGETATIPWLHISGAVEIVAGAQARDRLQADVRHLAELAYPAKLLSPRDRQRVIPGVRIDADESVVQFPTEAWIDVPASISSLTGAIAACGGRFVRRTVTGFPRAKRAIKSGLVAAITSPPRSPCPIVLAPGIIVRPLGPGRALLASDDHSRALDRAIARIPQLAGQVLLNMRLSLRAIPADGLTIAGVLAGTDNAYVLMTHSGFTLAPLLGRLVSRELVADDQQDLLALYRPSRFAANLEDTRPTRVDSFSA